MSISIDSNYYSMLNAVKKTTTSTESKTEALENSIKSTDLSKATDDELMKVAKDFEAYLIEQVMKQTREALVPKDEDEENEYLSMFGDQLYTEYAKQISDNGEIGLAQQLYESMKRNYSPSNIISKDN